MKKVLPYLVLLFLSGEIQFTFSWDSTAAKYYPLAVGNTWSFHRVDRTGFNCIQWTNEYDYIVQITSDTLMPNGKKYYKIVGPAIYYERIDSLSMNVYRYTFPGECIIDSLLARKNDSFNSCRQLNSPNQFKLLDTLNVMFLNESRRTRLIEGNLLISHQYTLIYGFGLYRESACENGGAIITLNGCIINGVQYGPLLSTSVISNEIPLEFSLSQNYPNPFNPVTKISFQIPLSRGVDAVGGRGVLTLLKIYNALGHEVRVLVNQSLQPGTYEVDWDASNHPSGVYFYELVSGNFTQSKKMVLVK